MKMANMDSAFEFMFTNPKDATGVSSHFFFFFAIVVKKNFMIIIIIIMKFLKTPSRKKILKPHSRFCLNLS